MPDLTKIITYLSSIIILSTVASCNILRTKSKAEAMSTPPKHVNTSSRNKIEATTSIYAKKLIKTARDYTGVPYRSGGNDTNGLDCSGLLCATFKEFGILLPRMSWQQSEFFPAIDIPNIQKGDLVFFVTTGKNINHAGIVTEVRSEDDIVFIHASSSKGVIEDNLMKGYWKSRFARVCRPVFTK